MKLKWRRDGPDGTRLVWVGRVVLQLFPTSGPPRERKWQAHVCVPNWRLPEHLEWGPLRRTRAEAQADAEEKLCALARGTLAAGVALCELCGIEGEGDRGA